MIRLLFLLSGLLSGLMVVAQTTVTYQSSTADFPNPERGFYRYTETRSANYNPLDLGQLQNFRNSYTSEGAEYSIVSSLAFRYFFLESFKNSSISQAYLDLVATDFATARAAGVKIIPRFAYTDDVDGSGCTSFICPPYGDAPKNIVLQHISQLAPILEANKDVIAAVQMGFIGVWGENYYTDHFGDASTEGAGKLVDADWNNRNEVLAALLAAVPSERMVQVRYPQQKQRFVYGVNAPTASAALTAAEAYSTADKARLGFHNDCLLASPADFGTYTDYGNSSSGVIDDTTALKPYFAADSRYVVVGGETCSDTYNPQSDCSSTSNQAFGDSELRRLHYSYLNTDFNQEVNNDWQSGGCMDAIKRSLGYRFTLQQGTYPTSAIAGADLTLSISLQNDGYAAPFNARKVELVLREKTSGELWRAELPEDPRTWQPESGTIQLNTSPCLPATMPAGTYELLLHLPDPMPTLYGLADYSIRLGSLLPGGVDGWESATGFNQLGHEITISGNSGGCSGSLSFTPDNPALPLQLLSFAGNQVGKAVAINWTTRDEIDLAHHELLRSDNGQDFYPISRELASNHGSSIVSYRYLDNTVSSDRPYYQLRSVDLDGTVHLSKIISIRLQSVNSRELIVSPNPSSGMVQLQWRGELPDDASMELYDVLGRRLLSGPLTSELDLSQIGTGTYSLVVRNAASQWVVRLVKK